MHVAVGHVVLFGISDHKSEICLKIKTALVLALLKLRGHSSKVHRVLDNVKVTIRSSVKRPSSGEGNTYFGALSLTGSTG